MSCLYEVGKASEYGLLRLVDTVLQDLDYHLDALELRDQIDGLSGLS